MHLLPLSHSFSFFSLPLLVSALARFRYHARSRIPDRARKLAEETLRRGALSSFYLLFFSFFSPKGEFRRVRTSKKITSSRGVECHWRERERKREREKGGIKRPACTWSRAVRVLPLVVRETKAARAREESQKRKLKYARGLIDVVAPD